MVGLQVQGDDPGGKIARNWNFGPESDVQRPQAVVAQYHTRLVRMHEGDGGPEGVDSRVGANMIRFDHIARRLNGLTIGMGLTVGPKLGLLPAGCQRSAMQESWW